jgi:hypothetical protein
MSIHNCQKGRFGCEPAACPPSCRSHAFHDSEWSRGTNVEDAGQARDFGFITLRYLLAGWFQAFYMGRYSTLHAVVSKTQCVYRCFKNLVCWGDVGLLGHLPPRLLDLFVVEVPRFLYLIGADASNSMVRVELPAGSASPLHIEKRPTRPYGVQLPSQRTKT